MESLRIMDDPDWHVWADDRTSHTFSRRVGIGDRAPLPRIPAVHEEKDDLGVLRRLARNLQATLQDNYPSVAPNVEVAKEQFMEEK